MKHWPLPLPEKSGGKESRGQTLIIAGSGGLSGAAVLAGTAALRAGAGKLQIATPQCVADAVGISVCEALVIALPESKQGVLSERALRRVRRSLSTSNAVLVGPGMSDRKATISAINAILNHALKVVSRGCIVLDSTAMQWATKKRGSQTTTEIIITPHAGEMAKLTGLTRETIEKNPAKHAAHFAKKHDLIVVLKGNKTFIAHPDGRMILHRGGNIGLGTSGSGDTLSGIITGLAARGCDGFQAAAWGVFLHGAAGEKLAREIGPIGYLARELLAEVPKIMAHFECRATKVGP